MLLLQGAGTSLGEGKGGGNIAAAGDSPAAKLEVGGCS